MSTNYEKGWKIYANILKMRCTETLGRETMFIILRSWEIPSTKGLGNVGILTKQGSTQFPLTFIYSAFLQVRLPPDCKKNVKIGPKFPKKSITFKYSAEK